MRKAQQSNRTFMLGTLVLGILVIGIVILFTALAYDLNFTQEEQQAQAQKGKAQHHFHLKQGFYPAGCDVYLNDILLYSGRTEKDTILVADKAGKEDAVIFVDHTTDKMKIVEIPLEGSHFIFTQGSEGIQLAPEHYSADGTSIAR